MKKTLLFCISLLAFSFHSFAEKGYVYERVTSPDQLTDGTKYVIALEGGQCIKECYAITKVADNTTIVLTNIVDKLGTNYLTNIPDNMLAQLSDKTLSDKSYGFKISYDGSYFNSSSPIKWSTISYKMYIHTTSRADRFWIQYSMSTTHNYAYMSSATNLGYVINGANPDNQYNSVDDLATMRDNSKKPGAFTFFRQIPAQTIQLSSRSGIVSHKGVIEKLPDDIYNNQHIQYWEDPNGQRYAPRMKYPTTGVYNGDEPITLTAVYGNSDDYYVQVKDLMEISPSDTLIFMLQDGGDGENQYGLHISNTYTLSWKELADVNNAGAGYKYYLHNITQQTSEQMQTEIRGLDDYFIGSIQNTTFLSALRTTTIRTMIFKPLGNGHFSADLGYAYHGCDNQINLLYLAEHLTSYDDQFAQYKNLNEIAPGRMAYAWKIYRKSRCFSNNTATFSVATEKGEPIAPMTGATITLPDVTETSDDVFLGWAKAENAPMYWKAGETVYLDKDTTLYAVFSAESQITLTLNTNGHGSWSDHTTADKVLEGYTHTLPAVEADYLHRFLGWSSLSTKTTIDYLPGDTYTNITANDVLYAIYEDAYIFRPIHDISDINEGDSVIIAVESGAEDETIYGLSCNKSNSRTTQLNEYLIDKEALKRPKDITSLVFRIDEQNGTWGFVNRQSGTDYYVYYDTYTPYELYAKTTTAKYATPYWYQTSRRVYLKFSSYIIYYWLTGYSNLRFSAFSASPIDQIAEGKDLSGQTKVSAITLYKKVPNYTLYYNTNGGTTEGNVSKSIGGTLFLPRASKDGYIFIGWSDGTKTYKAGDSYPSSGEMSHDVTLTALFEERHSVFKPITGISELQDGDTIFMTFGDGIGIGKQDYEEFGIYMSNCTTRISSTNLATIDKMTRSNNYRWVVTKAYNGTFMLYNAGSNVFLTIGTTAGNTWTTNTIYYAENTAANKGSYLDKVVNSKIQLKLTPWTNDTSRVALTNYNGDRFFSFSPVFSATLRWALVAKNTTYNINQWITQQKLTEIQTENKVTSAHPAAITIYRMQQKPKCQYTFVTGEHCSCETSSMTAYSITMPEVIMEEGWTFDGWSDGVNVYNPGEKYTYVEDQTNHTFTALCSQPPSLSESTDNSSILEANHGHTTAISLQRVLSTASLNTFAVPFDMNASEIETTFGEGTELYAMSTVQVENGILTIFFEDASSIAAGTPYLMRPTKNDMPSVIEISSRTINNTLRPVSNNGITFHPVFSPTVLNADGKTLFLSTGDLLYRPITTGSMKGLRAYFTQDEVSAAPIRYMIGRPHGIITDWNQVNGEDQLTKFIHNGQLLIRKNGKLYNALGAEIRK